MVNEIEFSNQNTVDDATETQLSAAEFAQPSAAHEAQPSAAHEAQPSAAHEAQPAVTYHHAQASESAEVSNFTESAVSAEANNPKEQSDSAATGEDAVASQVVPPSESAEPTAPSEPPVQLVLPLADMTPEERFRATTRLIFLAPDVPPVQPRQRRSEMRQLDDMLDRQFSRGRNGRDTRDGRDGRDGRDPRDNREVRDSRDVFDDRADRFDDERNQPATRRRNRRRDSADALFDEEGSRRSSAPLITEPQKISGSTRLEAKKQRRRDGRDVGRRRRMVITESEFLARRESVDREMIVRTSADRIQIGVLEDKVLVEHYIARSSESSLIGNVYLGRVQNVLPSMEAAFVDIGRGRNAVLYSGEVDWSEFEGGSTARRIENALKPGDQVLVQVTKDPVGHKGARLTSQISLPGRFLVYVPGGAMNGISRKLPDTERARLKKILKEVLPSGAGVIVRTAAEGVTEEQVTGDVQRLTRQWETIQARSEKETGPQLLHSEPDMLIKIIRDVFNEDFHKMIIQGEDTYKIIEDYLQAVAPELLERVERHESAKNIFDEYRINEQIVKALDRKVWLPSGGSLVIDRTEAMTVVDVNTGKFVGSGGNLEETVTKNNLEAAEEIVRQLRLRDIGGIIVIDFIDMVLESNRDLVLRRLVECLGRDRTKHQVAEVTSLGLVQMTRKKLGLGLLESFSEPCEVCAGRGVIVHHDPVIRHRSEPAVRSKRKSSTSTQASAPQAHAITDQSRSALAKIAASTIAGVTDSAADAIAEKSDQLSDHTAVAAETKLAEPKVKKTRSTRTRATQPVVSQDGQDTQLASEANNETNVSDTAPTSPKATSVIGERKSSAEDLLVSVLEALPPAPEPGTRRRASRRASTPQASPSDPDLI